MEMDTSNLSPDHDREMHHLRIENKHQFYEILWKIENMYVQCRQENSEIRSPEVEGPQETKLVLIVKLTDVDFPAGIEGSSYSFVVKRSSSDFGPETVWVNFRLDVAGSFDQPKCVEKNKLCSLNKGAESETTFKGMDRSFDESKIFKPGWSFIHCKIIIYIDDENAEFKVCSDVELRSYLALYESSRDYDIDLKIGGVYLRVRKSILCAHTKFFKRLIDPNKVIKILDLSDVIPDVDDEAVKKVIAFIYTGDLKYVLEKPSFSIHELVYELDIEALKKYYNDDSLIFVSRIESQEFILKWSIKNFKSVLETNRYILSPVLTDYYSSRTFQLHFGSQENDDYAAIFVETNQEIKWMTIWLEISAIDEDENLIKTLLKMLKTRDYGSKIFGVKEFVNRNWIKSYAISNILNISMRLKLFTERHSSQIENED